MSRSALAKYLMPLFHVTAASTLLYCAGSHDSVGETSPAKAAGDRVTSAPSAVASNEPAPIPTPTLKSIHFESGPSAVPTVEFSVYTNDEKGMPLLWGESLLARLYHKGFIAKGKQVHFRSDDEVNQLIDTARMAKNPAARFGEIRLIAEESPTDARIRIMVRELHCKEWRSLLLAPMGRMGTDEAAMMKLSETVELAVTESLARGFDRGFCE